MTAITRRRLLATSGVALAAAGAVAAIPGQLLSRHEKATAQASVQKQASSQLATEQRRSTPGTVPSVAYIRDAAKGEVVLMMGTRQVVRTDHELVAHLAHSAANAV